jgi:hypothetical protein
MAAWEYDKIDLNAAARKTEAIDLLNAAGTEGWELVHISSNHVAYLKRLMAKQALSQVAPERTARRSRTPAPRAD